MPRGFQEAHERRNAVEAVVQRTVPAVDPIAIQ